MSLSAYHKKRHFSKTPEPKGKSVSNSGPLTFVIQKHQASQLHYDFRLELNGVLKSWAVPKGPSLDPEDKRLAMMVEDHPMEYANFEGIIPKGNYGAGTVMVWDKGVYTPYEAKTRSDSEKVLKKQLKDGHLTFIMLGEKLKGEFALIKTGLEENSWLLIKKGDEYATKKEILKLDSSVLSNRSMDEIKKQAVKKDEIWFSKPKDLSLTGPTSQMPHHIKPMLAETAQEPFDKKGWIYEMKWDGFRAIAEIENGESLPAGRQVDLYSRNLQSFNSKFTEVVSSLKKFPGNAILDGEIVAVDENGHPNFNWLHNYPKTKQGELIYYIFDILYFDGHNLTQKPLEFRKSLLKKLLPPLPHLKFSDYLEDSGTEFFEKVNQLGLEGIMAKDLSSQYKIGSRSRSWLKIKTKNARDLVLKNPQKETIVQIGKRNVKLVNLNKIFWEKEKYTKGDLIEYYKEITPAILPYLKNRPESLLRYPNGIEGESFFQKDVSNLNVDWVTRARMKHSGKSIEYILCQDEASLLYIINLGCIDLNPWNSTIKSPDKPDYCVIDLDPEAVPFETVVKVAQTVRDVLDNLDIPSYPKTSGARGIHIYIPLGAKYTYEQTRYFADLLCHQVHAKIPTLTSLVRNPKDRQGKVYLDFLQNARGQTLASVYSVRPKPNAPVSTPLKWSEVNKTLHPSKFTMKNIPKRLQTQGDLFKEVLGKGIRIEKVLNKLTSK